MTARGRQSSTRPRSFKSNDIDKRGPEEDVQRRLAHIEATLGNIRKALDEQFKRLEAMQAQLDHFSARRIG